VSLHTSVNAIYFISNFVQYLKNVKCFIGNEKHNSKNRTEFVEDLSALISLNYYIINFCLPCIKDKCFVSCDALISMS